jgi:hypothetical protein
MRPSGVAAPLFVSLPATVSSKLILKFSTMLSTLEGKILRQMIFDTKNLHQISTST